uniref:Prefoldin subunit 5 n=1 Tax=Hemiselmis andersenii TaxID=464988 RepID=A0A6T8PGW7_HEMAN|mmetsp:Transcript_16210/g.37475  ORF Transcript_16210/g.37475 Transcript_16210/m.37475 type:complete len:262 (-) Transcript_16210:161-946(-)
MGRASTFSPWLAACLLLLVPGAGEALRTAPAAMLSNGHLRAPRIGHCCPECIVGDGAERSRVACCAVMGHLVATARLRGGASGPIDPEYEAVLKSGKAVQTGMAVGNVEEQELSAQLPWPEGSEERKKSFVDYQKQYKTAKEDLRSAAGKLQIATQQQQVHKITLTALRGLKPGAAVHLPVGRMFMQKSAEEVTEVLDYQSGKVLEEALCELQDLKEGLEKKVQRLEKDMQDLLNHVFRGRFQLFVDSPGRQGMSVPSHKS